MIQVMPRPRLPDLRREVTRHGRTVWYHQVGKGPRTRLRAEYGTQDFRDEYEAAVKGEKPTENKSRPQSLEWLVARYMESAAWAAFSVETRRQRGNILKRIVDVSGHEPFARITKKAIVAGIDRRKELVSGARHFLVAMRKLFEWAVVSGHAENDPTEGVKLPRSKKTDGFAVWPEEWCALYEARWPVGTHERVWYEVIYCTGLRRSDAVRVGRPHVKDRRGMIRAMKNDETAYFLVSDRLQAALKAGPTGELTWIVGKGGKPLTKESFGTYFREACNAAGVPGSAHGIRKTRATIEAERGASGAKLDALFGWKTGSNTSAIYIRKANRAKLAFGN